MNMNADGVQKKSYKLTQLGNAERLVANYGDDILYCNDWKGWLIWKGNRWERDKTNEIMRMAKKTIRDIEKEAEYVPDEQKIELIRHAQKSETKRQLDDMVSLAGSEENISILSDTLDKNHWHLNVKNGTINLKTGELQPHDRKDRITKIAKVEYSPETKCPVWSDFLTRIFDGNKDVIDFMKRAIGYALTGDTREQCLFFLYGSGANGKTTFLETISYMLNDYAETTDFSTFLKQASTNAIRNDLAGLKGARFVPGVEAEKGQKFAEAFIKRITGGDTIKARRLYEEYTAFKPTFKVFLASNYKPTIVGTDNAIWRRPIIIPFDVQIPKKEMDKHLKDKFKNEMSGILNWAIEGCLEWQKEGLEEPDIIKFAKEDYRREMDLLRGFIEECCFLKATAKTSSKELYDAYCFYCGYVEQEPLTQQEFGKLLKGRDLKPGHSGSVRYWKGIEINSLKLEEIEAQGTIEDMKEEGQKATGATGIMEPSNHQTIKDLPKFEQPY